MSALLKKSTVCSASHSANTATLAIASSPTHAGWPTQTLWPYTPHPTGHYNSTTLARIAPFARPTIFFLIKPPDHLQRMPRTQHRWGVLLRAAYLWLCPLSRALVGVAGRQRGKIDLTCSQIDRQRSGGGAGRGAPINSRRSSLRSVRGCGCFPQGQFD